MYWNSYGGKKFLYIKSWPINKLEEVALPFITTQNSTTVWQICLNISDLNPFPKWNKIIIVIKKKKFIYFRKALYIPWYNRWKK